MHLKETLINRKYIITLSLFILIYTLTFSYFTFLKHHNLSSYGWDLGVFNQLFYSSTYGEKLLYYTPDLYMNPQGNYFAIHFSPILFTLFPPYMFRPDAGTLLIAKCLVLALAALPLFYLTREITGGERIALAVSLSYLLHPGVQGANWFDFQPQVFIPLLVFSTYLMLIKAKWRLYLPLLLLTLSIQEHVFSIVMSITLGHLLVAQRRERPQSMKEWAEMRAIMATLIVCVIFFSVSRGYIKSFPIEQEFSDVYRASGVFSVIGFEGDTLQIPLYVVSHLFESLRALAHDLHLKLLYMALMFAPLLLLPLKDRFIVANLALFLPFLASNYNAYYMVGSHYSLYLLPSIFISLAYSIGKRDVDTKRLARRILLASALTILVVSPISPISVRLNSCGYFLWYPKPNNNPVDVARVHDVLELVPRDAPILTQNHLFPHASCNVEAYLIPVKSYNSEQTEIIELYVDSLIGRSDVVLLDLTSVDSWTRYTLERLKASPDFAVNAISHETIMYSRITLEK